MRLLLPSLPLKNLDLIKAVLCTVPNSKNVDLQVSYYKIVVMGEVFDRFSIS